MPIHVQSHSLEIARELLLAHGTNDLLPKNPWTACVIANWAAVKSFLETIDLETHIAESPEIVYAFKSKQGMRVTHDLEITDFLLLSAKVHELAYLIENSRDPHSADRIFSNRVSVGRGSLFASDGYERYQAKSLSLGKDERFSYVLTLDIVDFYNQLSTHRVENALEECGVAPVVSKAIEEILLSFNLRSSRGIPVGQEFSNLLAEAALNSVDAWLIQRGHVFVRYVDDFRIFCESWNEVINLLHDFKAYLNHGSLKLCLNDEKTHTYKRQTFVAFASLDPEKREETEWFVRYSELVEGHLELLSKDFSSFYEHDELTEEDLPEATKQVALSEAKKTALKALFGEALESGNADYPMLRHLLITCGKKRSNILLNDVLRSLEKLMPVFVSVIFYLEAVQTEMTKPQRQSLYSWVKSSARANLFYSREWLASMFMRKPNVLPDGMSVKILENWGGDHLEYLFQAALLGNKRELIRDWNERWKTLGPRQRRWLVRASEILAPSERSAFWKEVMNTDFIIDKSIVVWMKGRL